MRSSVIKTWLVAALILSAGARIWGQGALLDPVKIPLLAQAEVQPEAAVPPVEAAPAEVAPAAPAEEPKAAAPAAEAGILEEVVVPPAAAPEAPVVAPEAPVPAAPVELIEDAPVVPAAPAPAVEAVPETAPAAEVVPAGEAVPVAEGAPAVAPAPVDSSEAAQLMAQQALVRRQEQEIKARAGLGDANRAFQRQSYGEAAALYKQVLANLPLRAENKAARDEAFRGLSESQYYMINALREQDRLPEALELANEATANDPENRRLEKNRASIQAEMTRIEEKRMRDDLRGKQYPGTSPEARELAKNVDNLIRQGRSYLAAGDYKSASDRFQSALSLDPENKEAMHYLQRTGDKRFAASTVEFKATSENMIADVRGAWNPRDYKYVPPVGTSTVVVTTAAPDLLKKMDEIIIPEIEFRQANIHDVVDFLVKASISEDARTEDPTKKGVNIILNLGSIGAASARPAPSADPFAPAPAAASGIGTGVPEITFTARYISLLQAIKIITSVAGLKYRVEGSIVMIVPSDAPEGDIEHRWYSVEPTIQTIAGSAAPAEGAGGGFGGGGTELETRVSGTRGDMQEFFTKMGVDFPQGSSIQYQQQIGRLIVANTARNLSLIERILQEINVVPKQVEIEARFVEVNQSDLEELGFEWLLNDNWEIMTKKGGNAAMPGGNERIQIAANAANNGFTSGNRFFGNQDAGTLAPMVGGTVGSIMRVQSVLTNPEISMILHALERNGHADVLSAPKVTTRSGNEATIRVVTEYIYPTEFDIRSGSDLVGTGGNADSTPVEAKVVALPQNFETREVGVILSVIPEVSPEGNMINLNMRPEVVSDPTWKEYGVTLPDAAGNTYQVSMPQPFFQRRAVETQISIYDGATVVMGGLITEKIVTINDKIPFLGDIPIIGALFRNKGSESQKRNLLIFVTARLVDPAGKAIRTQKVDDTSAPAVATAPAR